VPVLSGHYWYEPVTGQYGLVGQYRIGFGVPGLNIGATSMCTDDDKRNLGASPVCAGPDTLASEHKILGEHLVQYIWHF
jgi:hypothetical protein